MQRAETVTVEPKVHVRLRLASWRFASDGNTGFKDVPTSSGETLIDALVQQPT